MSKTKCYHYWNLSSSLSTVASHPLNSHHMVTIHKFIAINCAALFLKLITNYFIHNECLTFENVSILHYISLSMGVFSPIYLLFKSSTTRLALILFFSEMSIFGLRAAYDSGTAIYDWYTYRCNVIETAISDNTYKFYVENSCTKYPHLEKISSAMNHKLTNEKPKGSTKCIKQKFDDSWHGYAVLNDHSDKTIDLSKSPCGGSQLFFEGKLDIEGIARFQFFTEHAGDNIWFFDVIGMCQYVR